jgi:hypothetical protein
VFSKKGEGAKSVLHPYPFSRCWQWGICPFTASPYAMEKMVHLQWFEPLPQLSTYIGCSPRTFRSSQTDCPSLYHPLIRLCFNQIVRRVNLSKVTKNKENHVIWFQTWPFFFCFNDIFCLPAFSKCFPKKGKEQNHSSAPHVLRFQEGKHIIIIETIAFLNL